MNEKKPFTVCTEGILESPYDFIFRIVYPDCVAQGGHDYCHEALTADELAQMLGKRFAESIKKYITEGDNT